MKFKKILSASALSFTLITGLVSSVSAADAIALTNTTSGKIENLADETPVFDTFAYGGNTSDTAWSFSLNAFGGNQYTSERTKTNNTAAYVKLTSLKSGKGINAWIPGRLGSSKTTITSVGTSRLLSNSYSVGSRIRLAVEGYDWTAASASGVWSPNNTGGYQ